MPPPRMTQPKPLVVAVDMGYGHLRAAHSLARALGTDVARIDRPPLAGERERRLWDRNRSFYEGLCRDSEFAFVGGPLRLALNAITRIPPLHPARDLSPPTLTARALDRLIARGFGRRLVEEIRRSGAPLVTTFFVPALIADRAGLDGVFCVVTDSDISRAWAPLHPARTRIRYCVPSERAARRLVAYGVPEERITFTGFPLPAELLGGPDLPVLRRLVLERLRRLDPSGTFHEAHGAEIGSLACGAPPPPAAAEPPLITFAVGGAGAQVDLARRFLGGFRVAVRDGKIRLALVAGTRSEVADRFRFFLREAGLEAQIGSGVLLLHAPDVSSYFDRFNALLARTDVLWTKPSELTFYAALGIPLVLSRAMGAQERCNRRFAVERGAAIPQRDPRFASQWIREMLADGTLAGSAWCGFRRLPQLGLFRVLETLGLEDSRLQT